VNGGSSCWEWIVERACHVCQGEEWRKARVGCAAVVFESCGRDGDIIAIGIGSSGRVWLERDGPRGGHIDRRNGLHQLLSACV
jgi:hypothetical protein